MQYRTFGNTGLRVSQLGFGAMRFTDGEDGKVDQKLVDQLVGTAYERGVNYFDTAKNYLNGQSEPALGKALKGKRDKVHIATKVGTWHIKDDSLASLDAHLEEQLTDLQTDYIDCYLLHALDIGKWRQFEKLGIERWLEDKQKEGKIRFKGFSYHGTPADFTTVLHGMKFDFTMIQYNYADVELQAGEAGVHATDAKGLGTAIMEPLRGGTLTHNLPPAVTEHLKQANPDRTPAAWSLLHLWDKPEVDIVISGMNRMDHLLENLALADTANIGNMSNADKATLVTAGDMLKKLRKADCTGCLYCEPECPQGIPISSYIFYYCEDALFDRPWYKGFYQDSVAKGKPCTSCGRCNAVCPQDIDIPALLDDVANHFGRTVSGDNPG